MTTRPKANSRYKRRARYPVIGISGRAGMIATLAIGVCGLLVGAFAAYLGERGAAARASRPALQDALALREEALPEYVAQRTAFVDLVIAGADLERLELPRPSRLTQAAPKIILIIDDVGLDREALSRLLQMPGTKTLSFLPYIDDVNSLARRAREAGAEVMLHLPMEPKGAADPGPYALNASMTGVEFLSALEWNLDRIDGIVGVNNHMGSLLTEDRAAMVTILAKLEEAGLFFLDSVTTSNSVVRSAGVQAGATVFARDVFIDPIAGDRDVVREQLRLAERIARETGYVVAIAHPRDETLDILGPWLLSAPFRGFELAPVSILRELESAKDVLLVEAPDLRR